eukprot:104336_1
MSYKQRNLQIVDKNNKMILPSHSQKESIEIESVINKLNGTATSNTNKKAVIIEDVIDYNSLNNNFTKNSTFPISPFPSVTMGDINDKNDRFDIDNYLTESMNCLMFKEMANPSVAPSGQSPYQSPKGINDVLMVLQEMNHKDDSNECDQIEGLSNKSCSKNKRSKTSNKSSSSSFGTKSALSILSDHGVNDKHKSYNPFTKNIPS